PVTHHWACFVQSGLDVRSRQTAWRYSQGRPIEITLPETIRRIRQKPMMSLAFRPALASTGRAQQGCSMLVQESPQATAMAVRAISASKAWVAAITTGLCTAHCPPPEGTKILTRPALMKVQKGRVVAVAKDTIH